MLLICLWENSKLLFFRLLLHLLRMQAHTCSSLYFCLLEPGTYPRDHEERLTRHAEGEEISASRKQCNKSTPVRERVPTATKHTGTDCFHQFYKTCPKVIENEMEMGKLQSKNWNANVLTLFFTPILLQILSRTPRELEERVVDFFSFYQQLHWFK